ncbi:hypothetical protein J7T55_007675 [Diaporthe amygdali]|uniref:uncharacterized protein n=1 Tax=Phomopsis amygdali TaxID=1214568 RepID=UPI0022FF1EA9|nr:uncharacterized protein J7T55_007675 [Diaporthe amygdali]KAJ0107486.1 hypothetical protein J7T55_007675 [Diaporthe amygdali]
MAILKLPLALAALMMLRSVEAACVEDQCYRAMYQNPAGVEECLAHFVTTVVPPPSTTVVTVTSGSGPITTLSGSFISASTIVPSEAIPTYIVRACYGDVNYRFESACSCIDAGPTITTAPPPVVTNTVLVPVTTEAIVIPSIEPSILPSILPSFVTSSLPPFITPRPLPVLPTSPGGGAVASSSPILVAPGVEPACLAVGGSPVLVTIQVDEVFAMSLTVSAPVFCINTPPPQQSSECNCASTLPTSAPFSFSSSFTGLPILNATSSSIDLPTPTPFSFTLPTLSFPTTSPFANFTSAASESATTSGANSTTSVESTSTSAESTSAESTSAESTSAESTTSVESTTTFESSTSSETPFLETSTSLPFLNISTSISSESTSFSSEPSITEAPTSSSLSSTSVSSSSSPSSVSSSSPSATPFVPRGPTFNIRITGGAYAGQYISVDDPTGGGVVNNAPFFPTDDIDNAAEWTLDAVTGIMFQEFDGAYFGTYFMFGLRTQWSQVLLAPADQVIAWHETVTPFREPFKCTIDYTADMLLTCGSRGWTQLMESDSCGLSVMLPLSVTFPSACANPQPLLIQAVPVVPDDEGISK